MTGFDAGSDFVVLKSLEGIFVDSLAKSYRFFFKSSEVEPVAVLVYGDDDDDDVVDVEVSVTFEVVAFSANVCLFLSNGLIRSDGFNVLDWNWL